MSDDNVIVLDVPTTLDIPPERILEGAIEAKLDMALVLGWTEEGQMYASCSSGNVAEILLVIEKFKMELLSE